MGWLRLVGSIKLGRAAARRTAPKLPRAIRVGPNEGDSKIGVDLSGSLSSLIIQIPGVYLIFRLKFRGSSQINVISDKPPNLGLKIRLNPGIWTQNFPPPSFGPTLMTRGNFGAVRLAAACPVSFAE